MFDEITKNLGTLKAGVKYTIDFAYKSGAVITNMISPCDCSNIVDLAKESKVRITYTPKPLPVHLKQEGKSSYKTDKNFDIHALVDGTNNTYKISFTAIITE
jgi:hypothetical protein